MARARTAIAWYRGDRYPVQFTLKDKTSGDVLDLTGCALVLTVDTLENPPDDTTKVFSLPGVLAADPTSGKVSFTPAADDTATPGNYFYDVQLTDAAGNVRTVVKDRFDISQDISK